MTGSVIISRPDAERILSAAEAAFPEECCGLLEGRREEDGWKVCAVHHARNLADDPRRAFLIDPQSQFEMLRGLRGTERSIIGCFHSHPLGRAEPSATDLRQAMEHPFIWIIAGGEPGAFTLAAFVFDGADFTPAPLATDLL